MCVAALPLIATVASTVIGAAGTIYQAQSASASANYQAQVNENNAIIADRNAADARKRGAEAEQEHRRRVSALQGKQTAVMAASGVDLGSGSPLNILADTAQMGELDAVTIRNNAEREALGYESQGMNFRAEAQLSRSAAKSARTAGMIGAAGSVVSGFGQVAEKWYKMGSNVGRLT